MGVSAWQISLSRPHIAESSWSMKPSSFCNLLETPWRRPWELGAYVLYIVILGKSSWSMKPSSFCKMLETPWRRPWELGAYLLVHRHTRCRWCCWGWLLLCLIFTSHIRQWWFISSLVESPKNIMTQIWSKHESARMHRSQTIVAGGAPAHAGRSDRLA